MSPVRERDRDRWEGPPRRRGSPSYDRGERDRDGPPRRMEREQPEEKPVTIPPVISWFVGQLPTPAAFNGMLVCIEYSRLANGIVRTHLPH